MNPSQNDKSNGPAERYELAIQRMSRFVQSADCLQDVQAGRDDFLYRLESLSMQRKNLEGALMIVLLGGTGVGKSTVINAIAGDEIAEVSPIRPCTTSVTFYSHRENDQSLIEEVFKEGDVWKPNSSPGLRRKILVDPPDFDSMLLSNRRKLLEVMRVADILLVVVDPEKYRNHSLYKLLARFREGRTFLFLMNKSDHGLDPAVVEDFRESLTAAGIHRPRIFSASALEAFQDRLDPQARGKPDGPGRNFALLEDVIRNEINLAEVDRIKQSNFTTLLRNTYQSILDAIPLDLLPDLKKLPGWAEQQAQETATRAASEIAQAAFLDNDKIRRLFQSAGSLAIGGIFGLYLAVTEKLTALISPRLSSSRARDPIELRSELRKALDRSDHRRLGLLIDRFSSECGLKIGAAGGRPDSAEVAGLGLDGLETGREIIEQTDRLIQEKAGSFLEKSASGWFMNIAYNIVPSACIIYFIYLAVIRIKDGSLLDLSFLSTFLIFMLIICVLQHVLAERGFRRKGSKFIKQLEDALESSVQELIMDKALPKIRAFSESLIKRVQDFKQIKKLI